MSTKLILAKELTDQIDEVLHQLHVRTNAEWALVVDSGGHLISGTGKLGESDPRVVAALAASEAAAITELVRRIGDASPRGSFLHEGESRSIYVVAIPRSFILIVVFSPSTAVGLVRLFANRAGEQLSALTGEFEELARDPAYATGDGFAAGVAAELDKALSGQESPHLPGDFRPTKIM